MFPTTSHPQNRQTGHRPCLSRVRAPLTLITSSWKPGFLILSLTLLLVPGQAKQTIADQKAPLTSIPILPSSLARAAVSAAVDTCMKDGYRVTAAVVDQAGVLKALLRADGAGPHTTDSSTRKAYTAASLRRPTSELANLIAKKPEIQALRDMNDRILILGGGLPIFMNREVVGGIGVGGAPGAHLDEACAAAGLGKIGGVRTAR